MSSPCYADELPADLYLPVSRTSPIPKLSTVCTISIIVFSASPTAETPNPLPWVYRQGVMLRVQGEELGEFHCLQRETDGGRPFIYPLCQKAWTPTTVEQERKEWMDSWESEAIAEFKHGDLHRACHVLMLAEVPTRKTLDNEQNWVLDVVQLVQRFSTESGMEPEPVFRWLDIRGKIYDGLKRKCGDTDLWKLAVALRYDAIGGHIPDGSPMLLEEDGQLCQELEEVLQRKYGLESEAWEALLEQMQQMRRQAEEANFRWMKGKVAHRF